MISMNIAISNMYNDGLSFSTMAHYFLFPINTAVSVRDKLTWLSDKCHFYESHLKVIV